MKKIITLSAFAFVSIAMNAQIFWTENFGTGTNRGQLASAYTGSNGAWAINTTGTNDSYADGWYVSATAAGTSVNTCSSSCITTATQNQTLHIGNAAFSTPFGGVGADTGSTYLTGVFCFNPYNICSTTNKRVQSPIINCTGKSNISISFLYYEGGEVGGDASTLVYSPDGGTTWSNINLMAVAGNTACTAPAGTWTNYTTTLPATANNNANVKIGFNWTNDNDGNGGDPSFAVDDITLSQSPTGINEINTSDLTIYAAENNIMIKTTNTYKLVMVTDMVGNIVRVTQDGNTLSIGSHSAGIYFVQLEMNGTRITKKILMQ